MQPMNQPTIMGLYYCHKKVGDAWSKTFGLENLKERSHLEDLSIGGKIILQWI
jgi:hypothetical protein